MSIGLRSGTWRGHYRQYRADHPQAMRLEFADGIMRGRGSDEIGDFRIEGEFRLVDGTMRLGWIKTYDRAHSVLYLGTIEDGRIVGTWDIGGSGDSFALEYDATARASHDLKETS